MTEKQYLLDHLHIFNPNKINSFDDTESLYRTVEQLSEQQCMLINEALQQINLGTTNSDPKWGITKIITQTTNNLAVTFTRFRAESANHDPSNELQSETQTIEIVLNSPKFQ